MSNLQVWVGGPCNTTFNIPPFSSDLAHSRLVNIGAITEDLCGGPGCVLQESRESGDDDLSDEYEAQCAAGGGTYELCDEVQDGSTTYRIGWCAADSPDGTDAIGREMGGVERASVWCSRKEGGAGRGVKMVMGMMALGVAVAVLASAWWVLWPVLID